MLLRKNIPLGYVLGKVKYEMLFVALYAVLTVVMHQTDVFSALEIPIAVPAMIATISSLLLGFRSNQAYERWWEARIIWGGIVNDSRSWTRQVLTFIGKLDDPDEHVAYVKKRLVYRHIAWLYALKGALRGQDVMSQIERLLTPKEIEALRYYDNKHNALLKLQGYELHEIHKKGWMNDYQHVEMERTLSKFSDHMGKCERIKSTIFPETYTLYIRVAILMFVIMLPFSLMNLFGYISIPISIAVSILLFLIEKMAIHLQDPFENKPTDTSMSTISAKIERDLKQMLHDDASAFDQHIPSFDEKGNFFVM